MGGFFGVVSKQDCVLDLFFGVDYHSHLGTSYGGLVVHSRESGFSRAIHTIANSPFRTKFEDDIAEMKGASGIGCISDTDPQPLIIRSHLGTYAITTVGRINNLQEVIERVSVNRRHLLEMSSGKINSTELVATLINECDSIVDGIKNAQDIIDGSMSIMLLTEEGIYAARDKYGRLPILIGANAEGYCLSFESFAYQKLGYDDLRDIGPGEILRVTPEAVEQLAPPGDTMRICAFLWTYYGYPNSHYEGVTVETMRYRCGALLYDHDKEQGIATDLDSVAGVPDTGTAHAIGYANRSGIPFSRPFVKYTPTWPRSFMPANQDVRNLVARMKLVPVSPLIKDKKLLFIDDSIVRGTQMRETVEFLYESGAKEVHIRSACPPIMYGCKYLNFSRSNSDMDLIARRTIHELEGEEGDKHIQEYADRSCERGRALLSAISDKLHFTSLAYQSVDGLIESIGISPCKVCTYCWTGKE